MDELIAAGELVVRKDDGKVVYWVRSYTKHDEFYTEMMDFTLK